MIAIKDGTYKGTRILFGNEKRILLNKMSDLLISNGYTEIIIPIIQYTEVFKGKVGDENRNMMFSVQDRSDRDLCLAPEYTAVVQSLSKNRFKYDRDVKMFYVQECFRGENPQAGRFRQFTQLGVEILNPTKDYSDDMVNLSLELLGVVGNFDFVVDRTAVRGLDYYIGGQGFEIKCDSLGSSKQVCGGGAYDGGIGFAIGIDRVMMLGQ